MPDPLLPLLEDEMDFSAIRAQGAGGQNVNKVSSAIHLRYSIPNSSLPEEIKERYSACRPWGTAWRCCPSVAKPPNPPKARSANGSIPSPRGGMSKSCGGGFRAATNSVALKIGRKLEPDLKQLLLFK